jgi:predicted CXXCH cytochrome family protein
MNSRSINNERRRIDLSRSGKICFSVLLIIAGLCFFARGDSAHAKMKLKAKIPALCYECHEKLKKGLSDPYVHFLFSQGKCITCHNAHVSDMEGLLHGNANTVCLNCHQEIKNLLEKGNVHNVLRKGSCTDCHEAHSGTIRSLLIKKEKDLCEECHQTVSEKENSSFACSPFRQGDCSACHNAHVSMEDNLLRSGSGILCKTCHAPGCTTGNVSISSATKDMDCTSCHSGHGSEKPGVLGPFGHTAFLNGECSQCHNPITAGRPVTVKQKSEKLCLECHKQSESKYPYRKGDVHVKNAKNPCVICHSTHASDVKNLTKSETVICMECHERIEKSTTAIEKSLNSVECSPIRDRKCFACHIPAHSDRTFNYRDDAISLCTRCHTAEHSTTHPVGPEVIDPRNNQAVTCLSCHSMHMAKADFLLTFDRNRALCIQCHKM